MEGSKAKPQAKPRAKGRQSAAAEPPAEALLSKHQAFRIERLHRSVLAKAAYNPRVISDSAKAKLKKSLSTLGLVETLVWNKTTGVLLSGHQRLSCLDALEGKPDYLLDVAVVELTDAQERAANISLNNANLQGEYDLEMLGELLKAPDIELSATGLELADVQVMFDDPDLSSLFAVNEPTAKALTALEEQAAAAREQAKKEKTAARREMLKKEGGKSTDDTEVFAVAMFKTREEREAFVAHLGYGQGERYVDGARLMERLEAGISKRKAGRTSTKVPDARGSSPSQAPKAKG